MRAFLLAAALSLAAQPLFAQDEGQVKPPPCQEEVFRQFDFWVGEWEVFTPDGAKAGDNSITVEEKGCLLVERWTGVQGSTGQSYNYVDREDGKWRQIWVSPGVTIDYEGGLNDKGEMVLEGTIAYPGGKTAPFRGVWTPNDDGSVTQHFTQYDAEKNEWADWFIGIYRRKE